MSIDKPFRVSYYAPSSVVDGRALLLSTVVRASSTEDAKDIVEEISDRKAVKAYPFYRNLKQPKRQTWHIVSGPNSPATKDVLADLSGFAAHDKHEQLMDTFQPKIKPPGKFSRFDAPLARFVPDEIVDPSTCKWHGDVYMVGNRCTKLDARPVRKPAPVATTWTANTSLKQGDVIDLGSGLVTVGPTGTTTAPSPANVSITGVGTLLPSSGTFDLDAAAPIVNPEPEVEEPVTCDDPNCPFCRDEDAENVPSILAPEPEIKFATVFDSEAEDVPEMEGSLITPKKVIVVVILIAAGIAAYILFKQPVSFLIHSH